VLIHGYFGGAWYFERYQRFLAERGHPTYAVNLRGHHGSRPVPDLGPACARDYVADALEVARWLGRPIVLGHSMGGLFALKLAESDAVCAAVLLCPAPPRGIPIFSFRLAWRQLRHLAPLILSRPLAPRPADLDALMFNRIPAAERPALYPQFVPDSGRVGRELSLLSLPIARHRVRCPMLVVTGTDDRFVVPRIARWIARKYRAAYREYPGHGHFPQYEPGWERPIRDIAEWLHGATA